MKKRLMAVLMAATTLTAYAQKGEFSLGAGFSYGFNEHEVGAGLKVQYSFTQRLRGELSANYWIDTENLAGDYTSSVWDLNLNAHYLFPLKRAWTLYPLAGVVCRTVTIGSVPYASGGTYAYWGANLGGGIEKSFGKHWKVCAELKGQLIEGYSQVILGLGVAYRF